MRIKFKEHDTGARLTWVDPGKRPWNRSEYREKVATSGATYGAPTTASFPGPTECAGALESVCLKFRQRGMSIRGQEIRVRQNEDGTLSIEYVGTITNAGIR